MKEFFTTATVEEWRKAKKEAISNRPVITATDMLYAQAVKFNDECKKSISHLADMYEAEGFDRTVNIDVVSPYGGELIGLIRVEG